MLYILTQIDAQTLRLRPIVLELQLLLQKAPLSADVGITGAYQQGLYIPGVSVLSFALLSSVQDEAGSHRDVFLLYRFLQKERNIECCMTLSNQNLNCLYIGFNYKSLLCHVSTRNLPYVQQSRRICKALREDTVA